MIRRTTTAILLAALTLACDNGKFKAQADSARTETAEQTRLATQLAAQKDSLTSVVLEADKFISQVDSQISHVKGLRSGKRKNASELESPIQQQIENRKEMLARVQALVDRTRQTQAQLARSNKKNAQLAAQIEKDQKMIADLTATIERQTTTIASLQARVDSLSQSTAQLSGQVATLTEANNRAYYIVGREKDLLKKGVITKEGGANLLVARVGRSVQPARSFDPALFTPIDQRSALEITVPDPAKKYRLVSRQSLDDADVAERDGTSFKGNLKIKDPAHFWSQSRYLILVER
jgi:septal ring factor EnvC (AmiA/AmiB activator)